jgi:hypothetical protein
VPAATTSRNGDKSEKLYADHHSLDVHATSFSHHPLGYKCDLHSAPDISH